MGKIAIDNLGILQVMAEMEAGHSPFKEEDTYTSSCACDTTIARHYLVSCGHELRNHSSLRSSINSRLGNMKKHGLVEVNGAHPDWSTTSHWVLTDKGRSMLNPTGF